MNKTYNEPEFKVVKMASEDVLTASTLDDFESGWTSNSEQPGGGSVPFLEL